MDKTNVSGVLSRVQHIDKLTSAHRDMLANEPLNVRQGCADGR